jgi:hypothetical protein
MPSPLSKPQDGLIMKGLMVPLQVSAKSCTATLKAINSQRIRVERRKYRLNTIFSSKNSSFALRRHISLAGFTLWPHVLSLENTCREIL